MSSETIDQILSDAVAAQHVPFVVAMSTLTGNLFIISAASNVIVVQQAEKFGAEPFTFCQFTRLVLPVTVVSIAVTYGWVVFAMPGLS